MRFDLIPEKRASLLLTFVIKKCVHSNFILQNMVNFLYCFQTCPYLQRSVLERTEETSVLDPDQDHIDLWQADIMLLLLLLTPDEVLKKTENRIVSSTEFY